MMIPSPRGLLDRLRPIDQTFLFLHKNMIISSALSSVDLEWRPKVSEDCPKCPGCPGLHSDACT